MIIDQKYLFIPINKCAGTALKECFKNTKNIEFVESKQLDTLNKMIDSKYKDYKKFAVVRNPYDRFQSLIKMLKRDSKPYDPMMVLEIIQDDSISYKAIHALSQDISSSFIKRHGLPMSHEHYCVCKNDKINIDYVFRYEQLSKEIVKIENLTDNKFKLKKLNSTDGVSIDGVFSDEVVSIINKVYEKDFDLFQYDREQFPYPTRWYLLDPPAGSFDYLEKKIDDSTNLIMEYETSNPEDGEFKKYWSNGNLKYEWYYKDGKRADGVSKGWWENGQLKMVKSWKNGIPDGLCTNWYQNGQLRWERTFKDGKLNGLKTSWYINGQKYLERFYQDGKVINEKYWTEDGLDNGEFILYHHELYHHDSENFKNNNEGIWKRGNLKNGKKHGLWTTWYPKGEKMKERTFKDGKLITETRWSRNGN